MTEQITLSINGAIIKTSKGDYILDVALGYGICIPHLCHVRSLMPNAIFLVPGFGAQGRTAGEVAKCFNPDGTGAIVNASRSVIYAYQEPRYRDSHGDDWRACIRQASQDFVAAIRAVVDNGPPR